MASKFFVCRSLKIAEILGVFQDFEAKTGGKFAARMCAAAIGTASDIPVPFVWAGEMLGGQAACAGKPFERVSCSIGQAA